MARRRSRRKKRSRARIPSLRLPRVRLSELEQSQLDAIGLSLVGAAVFFSLVFYFRWDGGEVGSALTGVLRFLLGKVAYVVPIVLLGAGAALMLRPALPEPVRPRAGASLLLLALTLGFAAGSFGLGPDEPARHGYFHASYFNDHGGLVGEALYFAASTLFQRA